MRNKQAGLSMAEILLITAILMIVFVVLMYPLFANPRRINHKAPSAQNNRQVALAGIMYGGDYDDTMPVTTNGWLCRMQDVGDRDKGDKGNIHLTVNCPAPGTQDFPAKDAAGGQRTDAWPLLVMPYIKSRGLFTDPGRADTHGIFASPAKAVTDAHYDREGATYRNQNRFSFYGMNYMYLSPLRIPKNKRGLPNAVNYAVSESHTFTEADDPSGTVYFTESKHAPDDVNRGFFVINAPGMWPAFVKNKDGYVAFWSGTAGSGDWVGTKTACADYKTPCPNPIQSTNFVYNGYNDGCNATFLDGHVKYYHTAALAAGTDYLTATAGADGSGAHITDKKHYLWNLVDKNYYGL
jgi:prepilin-type processing-associated H-X9-DG protein